MIIHLLDNGKGCQVEWESEREKAVAITALLIFSASYPPGSAPQKTPAGTPFWRALQGASAEPTESDVG